MSAIQAQIPPNIAIPPEVIHRLITTALRMRGRAYVPYSDFRVGAALLCADGTIIGGCNVENASYGGTICAERTAITKAVSEGHRSFIACAVTSQLAEPSVSPCGICRQVLREFLPLDAPVFMVASTYPGAPSTSGPDSNESAESLDAGGASDPSPPVQLERCLADFNSGVLLAERETKVDSEYGGLVRVWSLEELLPLSFGPDHLTRPRR